MTWRAVLVPAVQVLACPPVAKKTHGQLEGFRCSRDFGIVYDLQERYRIGGFVLMINGTIWTIQRRS